MEIYVARDGRQSGPFSAEQIKSMLNAKTIGLGDLAWHEGQDSWRPLYQVMHIAPPMPDTMGASPIYFGGAGSSVLSGSAPASFGIRLVAHIIDSLIAFALAFVAGFVIGAVLGGLGISAGVLQACGAIIGMVCGWLYYALMESSPRQATFGKIACGVFVTDLEGRRISFGRATGRYFGMLISSLILCIGHLMCIWTEKRQCLHDMMSGCLVRVK